MFLPSKLLLLSLPQAAVGASVSIQCTPVGCVHSLMANAQQIGKVSEWLGSVSLKASDYVAEYVAVQHFSNSEDAIRWAMPVMKGMNSWNSMAQTSSCVAWLTKA